MAADMAVMLAQKRQASLALADALMQQAPLQPKNLMAHRFIPSGPSCTSLVAPNKSPQQGEPDLTYIFSGCHILVV